MNFTDTTILQVTTFVLCLCQAGQWKGSELSKKFQRYWDYELYTGHILARPGYLYRAKPLKTSVGFKWLRGREYHYISRMAGATGRPDGQDVGAKMSACI